MASVTSKRTLRPRGKRWSGHPDMPVTAVSHILAGTTINESSLANQWAQFSASDLQLSGSAFHRAADPLNEVSINEDADSITVPPGVYLVEVVLNLDATAAGGEYKCAITGTENGVNTRNFSWRGCLRQDVIDGFQTLDVKQTQARFSMVIDTSEYFLGHNHATASIDTVTRSPHQKDETFVVRVTNNDGASAGTAVTRSGGYVRFTRIAPAGTISAAN